MPRLRAEPLPDLPNIEALVDCEGQVKITIGAIYPIRCVAVANDGHNSLAMLVRRDGETLGQLLIRLDAAIAKAYDEDKFGDCREARADRKRQAEVADDDVRLDLVDEGEVFLYVLPKGFYAINRRSGRQCLQELLAADAVERQGLPGGASRKRR